MEAKSRKPEAGKNSLHSDILRYLFDRDKRALRLPAAEAGMWNQGRNRFLKFRLKSQGYTALAFLPYLRF